MPAAGETVFKADQCLGVLSVQGDCIRPPGQRGQRVKGFLSQQLRVVVSQLLQHQLGDLPGPIWVPEGAPPPLSQSNGSDMGVTSILQRTMQC